MILDHLTLHVRDLARSARFYAEALAPLGVVIGYQDEHTAGLGLPGEPQLWLAQADAPQAVHLAFRAKDRAGDLSGRNVLEGVVTDASFTGLSTQYLVRTAWGQELQVFSQNLSADDIVRLGDDVVVSWDPIHSFGLDGASDLHAGMDKELLALQSGDEPAQVG